MKITYEVYYEEWSLGYRSEDRDYFECSFSEDGEYLHDVLPKSLDQAMKDAARINDEMNIETGRTRRITKVVEIKVFDGYEERGESISFDSDEILVGTFKGLIKATSSWLTKEMNNDYVVGADFFRIDHKGNKVIYVNNDLWNVAFTAYALNGDIDFDELNDFNLKNYKNSPRLAVTRQGQ